MKKIYKTLLVIGVMICLVKAAQEAKDGYDIYVPVYSEGTCVILKSDLGDVTIKILDNHIGYSDVVVEVFPGVPLIVPLDHKDLRNMDHEETSCDYALFAE